MAVKLCTQNVAATKAAVESGMVPPLLQLLHTPIGGGSAAVIDAALQALLTLAQADRATAGRAMLAAGSVALSPLVALLPPAAAGGAEVGKHALQLTTALAESGLGEQARQVLTSLPGLIELLLDTPQLKSLLIALQSPQLWEVIGSPNRSPHTTAGHRSGNAPHSKRPVKRDGVLELRSSTLGVCCRRGLQWTASKGERPTRANDGWGWAWGPQLTFNDACFVTPGR